MCDFFLSRWCFALPSGMVNGERQIKTSGGVKLSYRLNRGDVQAIREVWFEQAYNLPFPTPSGALLDLGANIGLTSVWMATQRRFNRIIAVEPDHENAVLLTKNLQQNGIAGEVIEAAVGPTDGTTCFSKASWSNLGKVSTSGTPVRVVSVGWICKEFELDSVALAKVDIEGSEQAVFLGPSEWLSRTHALIVEFHPDVVDYALLTRTVASHGFNYIPAVANKNMDIFVRKTPDF
jgi:FkbM family methyltransferase